MIPVETQVEDSPKGGGPAIPCSTPYIKPIKTTTAYTLPQLTLYFLTKHNFIFFKGKIEKFLQEIQLSTNHHCSCGCSSWQTPGNTWLGKEDLARPRPCCFWVPSRTCPPLWWSPCLQAETPIARPLRWATLQVWTPVQILPWQNQLRAPSLLLTEPPSSLQARAN